MVSHTVHSPGAPSLRAFLLGASEPPEVMREVQGVRPVVEQFARILRTDFTGAEGLSNG